MLIFTIYMIFIICICFNLWKILDINLNMCEDICHLHTLFQEVHKESIWRLLDIRPCRSSEEEQDDWGWEKSLPPHPLLPFLLSSSVLSLSSDECLLNKYYMLGILLDIGDITVNKTNTDLTHILVRNTINMKTSNRNDYKLY